MSGSRAFVLNGAPAGFRPVVQVIDDAARSYRLGAVFEARVGRRQAARQPASTSITRSTRDVAARQFRYSLLRYAGSRDFNPQLSLNPRSWTSFLPQRIPSENGPKPKGAILCL